MEKAQTRFRERGIGLAALSYDSVATLRDFSDRYRIQYPLLSDEGSVVIERLRMIDPDDSEQNIPSYGAKRVAYPGWFFVDTAGVVRERFVDPFWGERYTANNVIARLFPELIEKSSGPIKAAHLTALTGQSDVAVSPGSRVTLTIEIDLPKGMHLYAPGATGYKPLELALDDNVAFSARPTVYPKAEVLRLEAIQESVPVFRGKLRISQDLVISFRNALTSKLPKEHEESLAVEITGRLRYQACDETTCFRPAELPLKWRIEVHRNDNQRPKPENQRKGN